MVECILVWELLQFGIIDLMLFVVNKTSVKKSVTGTGEHKQDEKKIY